jgi:signal transduction histidine kinase
VHNGVAELERMVDGVLGNLHRLAMNLRPASLDYVGLVAALHQHIEAISDQYGLVAQLEATGLDERLSPELETAIYRIVQEALTNTVRHSRATRVDVLLQRDKRQLVVLVEDNGVGFEPDAASSGERLGLVGMRERVEMLGGRLTVESRPGTGTTVRAIIPNGSQSPDRR